MSHFPVPVPQPFNSSDITWFPKIIQRGKMMGWVQLTLLFYHRNLAMNFLYALLLAFNSPVYISKFHHD